MGSNNVLVGLGSVVLIDGGLGLVNVDRRRYCGAVNGVRQHEDQRQGQSNQGPQEVGVLCQRFLHWSNQRTAVLEGLYPMGCVAQIGLV